MNDLAKLTTPSNSQGNDNGWKYLVILAFVLAFILFMTSCKKDKDEPTCKTCTEVFIDNLDNGHVQRVEKGSKTYCNGEWVYWEDKVRDEHSPVGHNAKTIWECQ